MSTVRIEYSRTMFIVKYKSFGVLLCTGKGKGIKFIHNESNRQNNIWNIHIMALDG
jgi:hypothetical protein